jgi:hypothetical protein
MALPLGESALLQSLTLRRLGGLAGAQKSECEHGSDDFQDHDVMFGRKANDFIITIV